MSVFSVVLDVIAWPFYLMGGAMILLAIALVAAVIAVTVALIRRHKKK